jgi:glycosyltransferase involved in cell wall biosynthesis
MTDGNTPFFSIAITTYNRIDLLKKMLNSLLLQDFTDFEVIVGNDYVPEPLTKEILGIDDSRIKIINNTLNLGELGNMNSLLEVARGKYFTWQFDDDLCAPSFLRCMYETLTRFQFPKCIFSSFAYAYGDNEYKFVLYNKYRPSLYTGRGFLRAYLGGKVQASGLGGFHETNYLREIGGAERLTNGRMALYSEYLLILRDSLLPDIGYIKERLVIYRVHDDSFSHKSSEVELFKQAGLGLVKKALVIFMNEKLIDDFKKNLTSLLKSVISVVITKTRLGGYRISRDEIQDYLNAIQKEFTVISDKSLYAKTLNCLKKASNNLIFFKIKAELKVMLSLRSLRFVHKILDIISKYTNKSF